MNLKSKSGIFQIWVGFTGAAAVVRAAVNPPAGSEELEEARCSVLGPAKPCLAQHHLRWSRRPWFVRSWPHQPPPGSPDHGSSSAVNRLPVSVRASTGPLMRARRSAVGNSLGSTVNGGLNFRKSVSKLSQSSTED
ncbi:unnamed protein product [Cuscuta epithymum]|uniref:Uncharacterized protein n=1 Tax=Cuscuta epithymum TaxID=186058 RepID=A0AAV0DI72_9ASTE|nr:unnamed protein product [Cuscuta epithymum]